MSCSFHIQLNVRQIPLSYSGTLPRVWTTNKVLLVHTIFNQIETVTN